MKQIKIIGISGISVAGNSTKNVNLRLNLDGLMKEIQSSKKHFLLSISGKIYKLKEYLAVKTELWRPDILS